MKSPSAGRCGCIWPTFICIARGCSGSSRTGPRPTLGISPRDDLDKARKLIDECGYGRRREELEDAEAAWERLYGAPAGRAAN